MPSTDDGGLRGRRVLVAGASSGIGRAVAVGAAATGAQVVLAARRVGHLEEAVAEATAAAATAPGAGGGPPARALVCDTSDPEAALGLGWRAGEALGGLDAIVYASGTSFVASLATATAAQWHELLATNVVGASLVVAGALDLLRAAHDRGGPTPTVVVVSSHITPRPWPGLVPYAASKAALDALARGLRAEEPWLRVVDVVVGNTVTGFADGWDPAAAAAALERWRDQGYLDGELFSATDMAAVILGTIADPSGPEDVDVTRPAGR